MTRAHLCKVLSTTHGRRMGTILLLDFCEMHGRHPKVLPRGPGCSLECSSSFHNFALCPQRAAAGVGGPGSYIAKEVDDVPFPPLEGEPREGREKPQHPTQTSQHLAFAHPNYPGKYCAHGLILFQRRSPSHMGMLQNSFKYYRHTHFSDKETEVQGSAADCPRAHSRRCSGQSDPGRVTAGTESFTSRPHRVPGANVPHALFNPPH